MIINTKINIRNDNKDTEIDIFFRLTFVASSYPTPTPSPLPGGAPPRAQNVMKAKKFAGCLHTVFIDGENIGLWNFTESEGCGACNEGWVASGALRSRGRWFAFLSAEYALFPSAFFSFFLF